MSTSAPNPVGRWGRQAREDAVRAAQAAAPQAAPAQPVASVWPSGPLPHQPSPAPQPNAPAPQTTPSSHPLSPTVLQWSVVGCAVFLGLLFIVSDFLNWAHYEDDIATMNGFGWMTLEDSANGNNVVSNIFALAAGGILVFLARGVWEILRTDTRERGVGAVFTAGGIAVFYGLFALASKMMIGAFISDGAEKQANICRDVAGDYGAGTSLTNEVCGTYTSPFVDPQSGPGPVLCLLLGLATLAFAAVLAVMVPETRSRIEGFGLPVPGRIPTLRGGGSFTRLLEKAEEVVPSAPAPDPATVHHGVTDFWVWWPTVVGQVTAVVENDTAQARGMTMDELTRQLSDRVAAIDPNLLWKLEPGTDGARHRLVVTAHVFPELRGAARRWLNAAPAADARWSFSDHRAATPGVPVAVGGTTYSPQDALIAKVRGGIGMTLAVWHPAITGAPEPVVAMELVTATVGDRAASRWIYSAVSTTRELTTMFPLTELPDHISRREEEWSGPAENGLFQEQVTEDSDGIPTKIVSRQPTLPMTDPTFDLYVFLRISIRQELYEDGSGVEPVPVARDLIDRVRTYVHTHDGMVASHVLHPLGGGVEFYLREDAPTTAGILAEVRAMADGWQLGNHEVSVHRDPGWKQVADYRD